MLVPLAAGGKAIGVSVLDIFMGLEAASHLLSPRQVHARVASDDAALGEQ